jgi:hypothetical protein
MPFLCYFLCVVFKTNGFLAAQNPLWPAAWRMNQSTIMLTESSTLDADFLMNFGCVTVTWSYDKSDWVNQRPMMDEETMFKYAAYLKRRQPDMRVFVYRNLVKALNWCETNRFALEMHPSWFFKFEQVACFALSDKMLTACIAEAVSSTSVHCREVQSPVPRPATNASGA